MLDGSVRRAGQRVRIVAQLIDAATDQHLWAETYDRELTDIFAIQSDVALQIATALDAGLTADERSRMGKPPTDDLDAYQLYLQGRHCVVRFTTEGMKKGIGFYDRAIGRDPDFALAYAGMAMAYLELGETGSMKPLESYRRAQEVVDKALARDPNMGDVHGMNGQLKVLRDFDWAGAEAEFKRALELNPSSADTYDFYGRMCAALERHDEALTLIRRANELDPLAHRSDSRRCCSGRAGMRRPWRQRKRLSISIRTTTAGSQRWAGLISRTTCRPRGSRPSSEPSPCRRAIPAGWANSARRMPSPAGPGTRGVSSIAESALTRSICLAVRHRLYPHRARRIRSGHGLARSRLPGAIGCRVRGQELVSVCAIARASQVSRAAA